jgi:Lrp/AsnC family leucine-responsive transcriptional regulator
VVEFPVDAIDFKILDRLAKDSKTTLKMLSEKVGLSASPLQARIKKLEREGYIRGYAARLDYTKLGQDHIAFVQVTLTDTRAEALAAFNKAVRELKSVEQCHMIAGNFDYLLKVRTKDIRTYRTELAEKISSLPHVASTSTFVSMETVQE